MSVAGRWARRVVGALLIGLLAVASAAVGYYVRGRQLPAAVEDGDYEIREASGGLINPLLDCEVEGYRRGRELRPFKAQIEELVDRKIGEHAADRISVYFRDLDNGPAFGIREADLFTAASLLKVPTIMAALLQAEDDPAFLARTIRFEGYPNEDSPGQYVPEQRLERGKIYPVDELLRRAAAYSDNAAVGVLFQIVKPEYLERIYAELDVPHPPPGAADARSLSPLGYGHLFRVLYNASFLDRRLSERALRYFAESTFHAGIEAGIPPGVTVAHKFGIYSIPGRSQTAQLHDCGIVYQPGRPYFLCVMTEGREVDALATVIQEVARAVFLAVDSQPAPRAGRGEQSAR